MNDARVCVRPGGGTVCTDLDGAVLAGDFDGDGEADLIWSWEHRGPIGGCY